MIGQGYALIAVTDVGEFLIIGWWEQIRDTDELLVPVGVRYTDQLAGTEYVGGPNPVPTGAPRRLDSAEIVEWAVLGEYSRPVSVKTSAED